MRPQDEPTTKRGGERRCGVLVNPLPRFVALPRAVHGIWDHDVFVAKGREAFGGVKAYVLRQVGKVLDVVADKQLYLERRNT